ncbi:S28 family serine protease [Fodinicola acaciae]|uniref:S28 family serine protease n=1 Tax=Fodinicola acaciae TaxID=2681555 RepID=UPI001C9E7BDC|nr:S28 family serine protease [Fodinicola acaciae]
MGIVTLAGLAVASPPTYAATDIADQLKQLPGVVSVKEQPTQAPYRFFQLVFRQLVDHNNPRKGTFEQRVGLMHRDVSAPMVMYTTGYNYRGIPFRSEPTQIVNGNQIDVEYRFFTPSRPQPADWTKLNIWQAATDQHVIVQSLKKLYHARWLSTGGSKGGMTATYHRRFYPNDVYGTIPYVAPNDVIDPIDVYNQFLDNVGTDPACRSNLQRIQRETLQRRPEFLKIAQDAVNRDHLTFDIVGSLDHSLELSVIDSYFAFWQYQKQANCADIPPAGAPAQTIYDWYEVVDSLTSYSDQALEGFVPYYYQAGTQLGSPEADERYLKGLLHYPGTDVPRSFVPRSIKMHFDYFAMPDIDAWVRYQGQRLLYVYGQNDPWSAEPFRLGPGTRDSYVYYVAGGNHGSKINMLTAGEAAAATATIQRWAGVTPTPQLRRSTALPSIDSLPEPTLPPRL